MLPIRKSSRILFLVSDDHTMSHSHRALDSRPSIDSCTSQLHTWRPFQLRATTHPPPPPPTKALDSEPSFTPNPKPYHHYSSNGVHTKRPCLSDRTTSSFSIDAIDMSRLTLLDDDKPIAAGHYRPGSLRLIARKRRRRGSRSVSGRSSDRSRTRRCCSAGASAAAYGTCSDFPVAMGTDSSGELFGNGDTNWSSDVSEAKNSRRERDRDGGIPEKDNLGFGGLGSFEVQGNESGYGSEPGYRGDAEFGYGDEFDEEEDDSRLLFWGDQFGERRKSIWLD